MTTALSTFEQWRQPRAGGDSLIDILYKRFDGMYPSRFAAQFKTAEQVENWKTAWTEAFVDDDISPEQIATGLKACRRMYDWPPSLTEFLKACRPELEPEAAFRAAVAGMSKRAAGEAGDWPHPAVYWAAVEIGAHDLLNQSWSALKSRWQAALSIQMERSQWEPIPEPIAALPEPKRTEQSDKQATKTFERLAADKTAGPTGDPKAWARKILENPRGKSFIALKFAKEVAG